MIYNYDTEKEKRQIISRFGLIIITQGHWAGRFGYYYGDFAGGRANIYLYNSDFTIEKDMHYAIEYKHFARVELNEICYQKLLPPSDNKTYGWDRYNQKI